MCLIRLKPEEEDSSYERVRVRKVEERRIRVPSPRRSSIRTSRVSVHQSKPALAVPAPAALLVPPPQPIPVFVQPPPAAPAPPPPAQSTEVHYVHVSPRSSVRSDISHDDYTYERRRETRVERDHSPARSTRDDRYEYRYLNAPQPEERVYYRPRSRSRSRSRGREYVDEPRRSYSTSQRVIYVNEDGNRDSRYYD